jgi:general secretion pathway protein K
MFRDAARSGRRRDRGFALLIVLWTVALLALLTSGLTASGRGEAKLAENLRDAALAEAAADGAAQEAIFRLTSGQWLPGLVQHQMRVGDTVATVRIEDEAGLVNPNQAPVTLLAALLREVGADGQTAQTLASEINAFHNSGASDPAPYIAAGLPYGPGMRDFRDVAELRLVPGMTPVLYARLVPHLSVWTWPPLVLAAADPIVLAAFRDAGPDEDSPPTP